MKINNVLIINFWIVNIFFSISCFAQQKRNVDACTISKNINRYVTLIKSDSIKLILSKSDDNCNLRLIDTLCSKFLKTSNKTSFDLFTNVANKSDGYVSEYIVEKMGKIYYLKFESLFNFLYEDFANKKENKLEDFLVECWSTIATTSDNSANAIIKIRKNTQGIIAKQQSDSKSRVKYLNFLLTKINPKYLD